MKFKTKILNPLPIDFEADTRQDAWEILQKDNQIELIEVKYDKCPNCNKNGIYLRKWTNKFLIAHNLANTIKTCKYCKRTFGNFEYVKI